METTSSPFFAPVGFVKECFGPVDLSSFFIEVPVGYRVRIARDVGSPLISYFVDTNPDFPVEDPPSIQYMAPDGTWRTWTLDVGGGDHSLDLSLAESWAG